MWGLITPRGFESRPLRQKTFSPRLTKSQNPPEPQCSCGFCLCGHHTSFLDSPFHGRAFRGTDFEVSPCPGSTVDASSDVAVRSYATPAIFRRFRVAFSWESAEDSSGQLLPFEPAKPTAESVTCRSSRSSELTISTGCCPSNHGGGRQQCSESGPSYPNLELTVFDTLLPWSRQADNGVNDRSTTHCRHRERRLREFISSTCPKTASYNAELTHPTHCHSSRRQRDGRKAEHQRCASRPTRRRQEGACLRRGR